MLSPTKRLLTPCLKRAVPKKRLTKHLRTFQHIQLDAVSVFAVS